MLVELILGGGCVSIGSIVTYIFYDAIQTRNLERQSQKAIRQLEETERKNREQAEFAESERRKRRALEEERARTERLAREQADAEEFERRKRRALEEERARTERLACEQADAEESERRKRRALEERARTERLAREQADAEESERRKRRALEEERARTQRLKAEADEAERRRKIDQAEQADRLYRENLARKKAEAEVAQRRLEAEARRKVEAREQFRKDLIRDFGQTKASEFQFENYVASAGVDHAIASEVADEIFVNFARWAVDDGTITDKKRLQLTGLTEGLRIDPARAEAVEREAKNAVYQKRVSGVLADGIVTAAEAVELESLRQTLGVTRADATRTAERMSGDAYIGLLRRIVESGCVDTLSFLEVDRFKRALALSNLGAARIVRDQAVSIYREAFVTVIQDGEITSNQEALLTWLQGEINLSDEVIRPYLEQLAEAKELAQYRAGRLVAIPTRKMLEGGETCYWESRARYDYQTNTRFLESTGEILVTSKRVLFMSPTKTVTFAPRKIIDIEIQGSRISVKTDGRQGTGTYQVDASRKLEAILVGVARIGQYTATDRFASSANRHIPKNVKHEVWHRDGGRCVECGADQYLEYDHIIPHSRGGANSVGNIQILCRKCNLIKSDRI